MCSSWARTSVSHCVLPWPYPCCHRIRSILPAPAPPDLHLSSGHGGSLRWDECPGPSHCPQYCGHYSWWHAHPPESLGSGRPGGSCYRQERAMVAAPAPASSWARVSPCQACLCDALFCWASFLQSRERDPSSRPVAETRWVAAKATSTSRRPRQRWLVLGGEARLCSGLPSFLCTSQLHRPRGAQHLHPPGHTPGFPSPHGSPELEHSKELAGAGSKLRSQRSKVHAALLVKCCLLGLCDEAVTVMLPSAPPG